ncbi:hypothetical protein M011DRAFT_529581 [Sporormia fimetaria CBS 119925]|uniref:Uncharacterized protein n=1 Tax=Sporormia fimetaria CBS 119925 TaxID=1340428 RepID=A0A6A6UZG8_9PLEO|nr:hypothetical protein M011DRAFT_529581 [Sporormia fimetaria CBS 119925]
MHRSLLQAQIDMLMACSAHRIQTPDIDAPSDPRERRPAFMPVQHEGSTSQAVDLARKKLRRPLPAPDPDLFQSRGHPSPPRSVPSVEDFMHESVETAQDSDSGGNGPVTPAKPSVSSLSSNRTSSKRHPQPRSISPDVSSQQGDVKGDVKEDVNFEQQPITLKSSLRKHSAFVVEEERKSQRKAREDTPHLSGLWSGEDLTPSGLEVQDAELQEEEEVCPEQIDPYFGDDLAHYLPCGPGALASPLVFAEELQ